MTLKPCKQHPTYADSLATHPAKPSTGCFTCHKIWQWYQREVRLTREAALRAEKALQ